MVFVHYTKPMFGCVVPFPHQAKINAVTLVCTGATYSSFSKSRQFLPWDASKLAPPHILTSHVAEEHVADVLPFSR